MLAHLARTFADLFVTARGRAAVLGLLLVLALVPVAELLVIAMFSDLIVDGPRRYAENPAGVYRDAAWFFLAFAATRAAQHAARFGRIAVFRNGLESSGRVRGRGLEAWEWALALELSIVLVSMIQILTFTVVFLVVSVSVGLINALVCGAALAVVIWLYGGQLHRQQGYLDAADSTSVAGRVGGRIRDAELGSVVATVALAVVLLVVLAQTLTGAVSSTSAIVLFLGLRLLYGQVGTLAASVMRFARAAARRGPVENTTTLDPEPPSEPSAHRSLLLDQALAAGRRGDTSGVAELTARLAAGASPAEHRTLEVARAFAELASPAAPDPVRLAWWIRPFPGPFGHWLSAHVVHQVTGRPVVHHSPLAAADAPHLRVNPAWVALAARWHPRTDIPSNGRSVLVRHPDDRDLDVTLGRRMDELSPFAAQRSDLEAFLGGLSAYAVVVTSDPATVTVCRSYRLRCVPISFAEKRGGGSDLERWEGGLIGRPRRVSPDLRRRRWRRLARIARLEPFDAVTLDGLASDIRRAVAHLDREVTGCDAGSRHPS